MSAARIWKPKGAGAAIVASLALVLAAHVDAAVSEAQVKAAYLYKLASFVRWPSSAFADPAAPIRICVAGRGDVHAAVDALTHGQAASGRRLSAELVDLARTEPIMSCQILFIGQSDPATRALLAQIGQRPILTVTDRDGGTRGGVIEFLLAGGNVRFTIHRRAAEVRQLTLSSKLLAVAASVEP